MMSFLRNLFRKKQPVDNQEGISVSRSGTSVTIDGEGFPLVSSVDELCAVIESNSRGALRFRSVTYGEVISALTQKLEKRYGRMSRQFLDSVPSPLLCAGCLWEFPGSYRISLQMPGALGFIIGATPGFDQFGKSGTCPQCGNDESLLVYELFRPERISSADVNAIRRYWQEQARFWWGNQNQQRSEANCDSCNDSIARNQGYLSGSSLICERCVNKGLMMEGLWRLRSDPHFYGAALLRKVRRFRS